MISWIYTFTNIIPLVISETATCNGPWRTPAAIALKRGRRLIFMIRCFISLVPLKALFCVFSLARHKDNETSTLHMTMGILSTIRKERNSIFVHLHCDNLGCCFYHNEVIVSEKISITYISVFHKWPLILIPVSNGTTKVDSHLACGLFTLNFDLMYITSAICVVSKGQMTRYHKVSLWDNIPEWWPIHPVTRLPKLSMALCSNAQIVEMEIVNSKQNI